MNRLLLFLAALLLGTAPAAADILVENVNGYTLREDGRLHRFQAMWIGDDGKVRQVFEAGDRRPSRTAFRIDGRGRTLLPGLIDAHGH
ncbi:MAG TPA: amidohydrolase, partial [Allosphingosinicella sp.]|nr:amidohydrolase [Allosphingosinicella sp.]